MAKGDIMVVGGVEYVQAHDDGYKERYIKQLADWVDGSPVHNDVDEECCPDFACCNSLVKTDEETRRRFALAVAEGDEKTKMAILGGFLGAAFATMGKTVYVAGDGAQDADKSGEGGA